LIATRQALAVNVFWNKCSLLFLYLCSSKNSFFNAEPRLADDTER